VSSWPICDWCDLPMDNEPSCICVCSHCECIPDDCTCPDPVIITTQEQERDATYYGSH